MRRIVLVDIGNGLTLRGVLPSVALHADYSDRLSATGGTAPYTYSVASGALPDGLFLDPVTGIISGTASAAGEFGFVVRATDLSGASVQRSYAISVVGERLVLTLSGTFDDATVGTPYSSDLTISDGSGGYSLHGGTGVISGSLPDGLALSIVGDKLRLSGTPMGSATTVNPTVAVDSGDGQTASSAQSVVIISNDDPYWSSVLSLMHFEGANNSTVFTDSKDGIDWKNSRDFAKITTAWSLFGSSSFDVSGRIQRDITPLGTSDFTFEGTLYATSAATRGIFALPLQTDANEFALGYDLASGGLQIYWKGSVFTYAYVMPLNTPVRWRLVRSLANLYLYIEGTLVKSQAIDAGDSLNKITLDLGDYYGENYPWIGYMDEFRITKAARSTGATYVLDTQAFPN